MTFAVESTVRTVPFIAVAKGRKRALHQWVEAVGNKPFMFSSDFPYEVNNECCKHEIEEIVENDHLSNTRFSSVTRSDSTG
jgi:hypothetical protein